MADSVITRQELVDAQKDAQTLEEVVSGNDTTDVKSRLNRTYPTLAKALKILQQAGGAKAYETLALAKADTANLEANTLVYVSADTDANNGLYFWNGTTLTKSGYDPLAQAKAYVANTGYASIVGAAVANINYTTADRKLTFANTLFVTTNTLRYQLTSPQSVELPLNTPYRLQINTTTKLISAVAYTTAISEGDLTLGFVTASSVGLKTVDFAYAVDGVVQDNLVLAKAYVANTGFANLVPLVESNINFDTSTTTLQFRNTIWVLSEAGNIQLTVPQDIVISTAGVYRLEYNISTKTLAAVSYTSARTEGSIPVAVLRKTSTGIESYDLGKFTTDSVYVNPSFVDTQKADLQSQTLSIDLAAKTFVMTSDSWVYTSTKRLLAKAGTYSFPSTTGHYYALLNKTSLEIEVYSGSTYLPLLTALTHYFLFSFDSSTGATFGYTGRLTVVNGASTSLPNKTNFSLIITTESGLNFDFNNDKISITEALWMPYYTAGAPRRIQIPVQEIALDADRSKGSYFTMILVDPTTSSLFLKDQTSYDVPENYILIGAYREKDLLFYGLRYFSVNGEPYLPQAKIRPAFGFDTQLAVDVGVTDNFTPSDTVNLSNLTSDIVYGWFDALLAKYPDYITKTNHGNDASDLYPIYSYRFKPKKPSLGTSTVDTPLPKVMLITIHNEKMNQVGLYILMREICESWSNSEALTAMRHNIDFLVMPLVNPWGLNNASRPNSRQVDINRNFPIGWQLLGSPGDSTYSGTEALSEPETQYAWQMIQEFQPDVFLDCHSYGAWNNSGRSLWIPTTDEKSRRSATAAAIRSWTQYKKKYDWITDIDVFANISNDSIVGGGVSSKSGTYYGAVGGTLETSWNLKGEPSGLTGHSSAVCFTADFIGMYILQCLAMVIDSD